MAGLGLRERKMNTKSYCDNENMPSQQAGGDGGPSPGERRIWHLIFLSMKDDNALAGANFFQMEKNVPSHISGISTWTAWIFITDIFYAK